MRLPLVRIAVGLVGLAAVGYGVAGIVAQWHTTTHLGPGGEMTMTQVLRDDDVGGALVGLGLVAFAAWPRRSKAPPTDA